MKKEIPFYKFERAVRYKPDEIEKWLETRRQEVKAVHKDAGLGLFETEGKQ
jgi:hypothetical protein